MCNEGVKLTSLPSRLTPPSVFLCNKYLLYSHVTQTTISVQVCFHNVTIDILLITIE